jgi:aryl-alcohol dehydrogenase-like predicted oxidoreductase
MEKRQIGRSELHVAPLALGTNVFGWTASESASFDVLDAFVEAGLQLVDTADIYSRWASGKGGESETIIGKWVKSRGSRDKITLATKVGMDLGEGKKGLRAAYIIKAIEDSLKRLQTDYIDLYQSHQDDATTPQDETLKAYADLISAGKVRVIGASNFSAARLSEALELHNTMGLPRYECLQPHYNLCRRDIFEGELEELCLREHIGVIGYFSLASGFLTGKYRSQNDAHKSVRGSGATAFLNEKGFRILAALDKIANHHACPVAAVALAWLIARPSVTAPIVSAVSKEQLKELVPALHIKLSEQEIEQLNIASV